MATLAMIHTGQVVIDPMRELARELLPGVRVVNYLDDRIIADITEEGSISPAISNRILMLARAAREAGADRILLTCSSISGLAAGLEQELGIPVLRIDEAMADQAVSTGPRIGVVATLATTLRPTCALIEDRAVLAGVQVSTVPVIVDEAFERVASGDGAGHDELVRRAVLELVSECDVVVLAQASMARAVEGLDADTPILVSPSSGMRRLRELMAASAGAA